MENRLIKLKILALRRSLGYTQESMARALNISVNSYCQIETGKTMLVSNRVFEIAKLLNTTPEELIIGIAPKENNGAKVEEVEMFYKERIARIEAENKIAIVELEAEIQRLNSSVETREKIIGVLKENMNIYKK